MAILSKIRDRSGFLILVIGLAMLSFVVSPKDIIDFFSNKNADTIGKVNDKDISYKEFATRVENFKAQNQNASSYGAMVVENMVWNQLVREKVYETKLEQAGIVVGEKEIWETIIGSNEIKSSPQFKNKEGVFSEGLLKEYVAGLSDDNTAQGKVRLQGWLNYEKAIKQNLKTEAYNNLIKAGIDASEPELVGDAVFNNTSVTADYVYLPFSSIPDTEVKVTEDEVKAYVEEHEQQFKTEATRDIKLVQFSFKASQEDEEAIKQSLIALIGDKKEYNKITKSTELVKGFKNTEEPNLFVSEVGSDLPLIDKFQFEKDLPDVVKTEITQASIGTVVGPYKFSKYYKLTKVLDFQKIPDSVQASHILISHIGAQSASANVTRSMADAQKLADSLSTVIKKAPKKFGALAENYSSDPGSAAKKGDLGWFNYAAMVPAFRDFCFENKKGTIDVVKTAFGFHVIAIKNQKNFAQAYKLTTIARTIEASEKTESKIFEQAEIFANQVRKGADFDALVKENKYAVNTANGLKILDVYVAGLGQNRRIVKWAFDDETKLNATKRFDLDEKGYAVVMLTQKQKKGLTSAANAFSKVEPILIKQKKATLLKEKMVGKNLADIAKATDTKVETFDKVTLDAPTISGVGIEANVVSAAVANEPSKLLRNIVGEKGVFAVVTKSVNVPEATTTNTNSKLKITTLKSTVSSQLFDGLKAEAVIDDYRSLRY